MAAHIRARDWSATSLGPISGWNQALRTALRLLLTSGHPMFVFWGRERLCFYNDAYARLLGPERHPHALGQPGRAVWDEIWPVIGPQIEQVMSGGPPTWFEDQLVPITRHGRREDVWWTYGYAPLDDATAPHGVGGTLVICNDVTAAHLDRDALRNAQARTEFALAAADTVGTWDWDIQADLVRADARFARLFGVDVTRAAAGAPIAAFTQNIHPEDSGRAGAAIEAAVRTGEDFVAEYRLLQADGSVRWVAARGRCLHAPDGTPVRFPGVCIDITDRKNAECKSRALLALDARLRGLENPAELAYAAAETLGLTLGVSRAGYGTIDPQTETITIERDWNAPGIKSIAGVLKFRDYGSYIDDLKRGDTVIVADAFADPRTAFTADALKAISAAAFINMPVTEHQGLVALLYLNHAEPRAWPEEELAFIHEVAQRTRMAIARRMAEADLRHLAASLETQVAARTKELMEAEAALRQSQKMEAVGQLTGGLAHDFNNLLTGITGSLELLQARLVQGRLGGRDAERYVAAAQGAARRAAALTHRLLAFSRRQTLDPKPTNVNRLIAGMEELIRRTMGPSVTVEVAAAGGLWTTLVDPHQLENALLNLTINARDAMPHGGKLTIETANKWLDTRAARERDLSPGQYVALSVTDSGTGMTQDVINHAFDPFFTTKPIGQGTGLGLSMIYGFVRQSGGHVRIYSEVGQGTTLSLYLPRHNASAAEAAEAIPPFIEAPRAGHNETVLVVDDEPTVRMLVTEVLQELGYHALEASDGAAGLRILQTEHRIDLLVTDVGLPGGMNGRQLADAARAVRPALRVLFITGYAENAVLSHGHLDAGMHVLTKPFAMEALATRIRELIVA